MTNEISVLIADVSEFSKEEMGNELSNYLQQLKVNIAFWTQNIGTTKISHQSGDQLVIVSQGYATAHILAFYINQIWKYKEHPPLFGLSFGNIEEDLNSINIDTWIHPLIKQARKAKNDLKKKKNKIQFRYALLDSEKESIETLLNTSLTLQQEHMNGQTEIQSLVLSLYLILGQQNKVSQYLGRTTSTISSHMKQGKTEMILNTFSDIIKALNSLQRSRDPLLIDQLQLNIKQSVKSFLHNYFPADQKL